MAAASVERVVVTVDDQHLQTIQSVADGLRAAGMQVSNVLSSSGIIAGTVPRSGMHALASVAGVASVEPDQEMHGI